MGPHQTLQGDAQWPGFFFWHRVEAYRATLCVECSGSQCFIYQCQKLLEGTSTKQAEMTSKREPPPV